MMENGGCKTVLTAGCDIHIFDAAATLLYCGCLFGSCHTKISVAYNAVISM